MPKEHVLVVEDEEDIQELIQYNLAREGYKVSSAFTGEDAVEMARRQPPELVILDLMLPGMDGFEVCKALRTHPKTAHVPVVMLTAKGEEVDIVTGLELGADDYLTKPFSPRVLVARIRAVLRRRGLETAGDEKAVLERYGILIHPGRHEVLVNGVRADLTATEFRVLHFLARRPGWVFSRYQIVDAVHGENYPVTERSVDVQVVGLRKKLGEAGDYIETVRGVGYRFKDV